MRLSVVLVLSIGVAAGACSSQSLTGDMSGTGGAATGPVATGGSSNDGSGGAGGTAIAACMELSSEYQQALPAALGCDVGAAGQCQHTVASALSVCGSCPIDVTDPSKLNALKQRWDAANCQALLPKLPCPAGVCLIGTPAACLPADGGTRGVCSYVPGGGPGTVDGGAATCGALAEKYAAVLATAKSCSAGATDQCTHAVPARLSPCRDGCVQYVNDGTELASIQSTWMLQGCDNVSIACPAYLCSPVAGGAWAAEGGGAGGGCNVCRPVPKPD